MIKHFFWLVVFFTCLPAFAHADGNCRAKDSAEIIKIFNHGITLNQKFKKSVGGGDKDEYRKLRKSSEQYDEGTVIPCVRRVPQLLSKRSSPALMHKLMQLVISYENSADETVSYSMGKVFAANPEAVESGIKEFPKNGRKLIANSVQTGWVNVKAGLNAALVANRDERIKKLEQNIGVKP